jgi:hypothetical protein
MTKGECPARLIRRWEKIRRTAASQRSAKLLAADRLRLTPMAGNV